MREVAQTKHQTMVLKPFKTQIFVFMVQFVRKFKTLSIQLRYPDKRVSRFTQSPEVPNKQTRVKPRHHTRDEEQHHHYSSLNVNLSLSESIHVPPSFRKQKTPKIHRVQAEEKGMCWRRLENRQKIENHNTQIPCSVRNFQVRECAVILVNNFTKSGSICCCLKKSNLLRSQCYLHKLYLITNTDSVCADENRMMM